MGDEQTKEQFIQEVEMTSDGLHESIEELFGSDSKELANSKKYKKELGKLIEKFRMGGVEKRRVFDNDARQRFTQTTRKISDGLHKSIKKTFGRKSKKAIDSRKAREKFEQTIIRSHITEVLDLQTGGMQSYEQAEEQAKANAKSA